MRSYFFDYFVVFRLFCNMNVHLEGISLRIKIRMLNEYQIFTLSSGRCNLNNQDYKKLRILTVMVVSPVKEV